MVNSVLGMFSLRCLLNIQESLMPVQMCDKIKYC